MIEIIIIKIIVPITASWEYSAMSSLFSHAIYQIVSKIIFQIQAQTPVKIINFKKFILNTQAGILISCLTAGINLPLKVVILPCFWKNTSAWS